MFMPSSGLVLSMKVGKGEEKVAFPSEDLVIISYGFVVCMCVLRLVAFGGVAGVSREYALGGAA